MSQRKCRRNINVAVCFSKLPPAGNALTALTPPDQSQRNQAPSEQEE
jgi:hypothetical protein